MTPDNLDALRGLIVGGGLLLFLCGELLRPYRPPTVAKTGRLLTNISLAALNTTLLQLLFSLMTFTTLNYVVTNHTGLLNIPANQPLWLRVLMAVLLMDFMLYIWHNLNHTMPLLWRFHRVHHSDLNMDVSTATRFHIGELAISAVIKLGLIYFLGVDLISLFVFESLLVFTAQFQHSSIEVPEWFEGALWPLFVPPSMHRIHHSVKIGERNTNYGTILSLWDRIFGTLLKDIEQEGIVIGIGAYREPAHLKLRLLLWMPFTKAVK